MINDMERNGVGPNTIDTIRNTMRIQGGGAANVHIANAINGEMQLPNFRFQVPVSLKELRTTYDDPIYHDYLHMRDTLDQLYAIQGNPNSVRSNARNMRDVGLPPGPPQIRGQTVQSAMQWINNFEASHPDAVALAREWRRNVDETRRFLTRGEYGIMSNREYQQLRSTRGNYVPWEGEEVTHPINPGERGSPFDAMQSWMQDQMYKRMSNEIKGQWVTAMEGTGANTVMPE
jgi:hypothetical protein